MTNVGNINATLTLSQWEFNNGLKQSETAAMQFGATAEQQSRRVDAALAKTGKSAIPGMFQQAGYALQDFSSQFETRGLGGAIGAVTNNVQAMGAALGPQAGAAIAIGAAIGGIILPATIDWLYNTKELAKEAKELEEQYKRVADQNRFIAGIEVRGGSEKARKDLEETIEINRRERQEAGQALIKQENAIQRIKKELEDKVWFRVPETPLTPAIPITREASGANARQLSIDIAEREKQVEKQREHLRQLNADAQNAQEKLRRINPEVNQNIKAKEQEEQALKQYDLEKKLDEDRRKASQEIERKALQDYGTESQRVQEKLAEERAKLDALAVSKETKARFEGQAAVMQSRALIADQERALSAMGTAAGMSAGVDRSSAAGVSAINRALAGGNSEQSIAKEALEIQKKQLEVQEQIARGRTNITQQNGSPADELLRESIRIQQEQLRIAEQARNNAGVKVTVVALSG